MKECATLIYANGIGDHVLSIPTVRALSCFFGGKLRLVSFPGARLIHYRGIPFSGSIPTTFIDCKKGEKRFDARKVAMRVKPCPLLLSLNPWHSESMSRLLELLRPEVSIGYHPEFQVHIPLDYDRHSADLSFELARVFDKSLLIDDYASLPKFPRWASLAIEELLSSVPKGFRIVVVHADTRPWKQWKRNYFSAALHEFLRRRANFVAFVVGTRDYGLEFGSESSRVIPCFGLHLLLTMCLISRANLFLGVDSYPLHLADLARIPGVGLFGGTRAKEWGFRFGPHVHINCGREMRENVVDEVVSALESLAMTNARDLHVVAQH